MSDDDRLGPGFFLRDPAKLDDPHADLDWLRAHHPIHHDAELGQWFAFRHDDVTRLFVDRRLSADRMKGFVDAAPESVRADLRRTVPYLETWLIMKDAPDHAHLRTALHRAFNAKVMDAMVDAIGPIADELLDTYLGPEFDVAADYAFRLPVYVLTDFMGIDTEDRDRVAQWSVDFVDFFNVVPINEDTTERMVNSTLEMRDYVGALLAERRSLRDDRFLGTLAGEAAGEDGLSEEAIIGNAMLLLIAGHYAVRNLIGNLVWLMGVHRAEYDKLRADPGLLVPAIDEALRYETPITMIPRITLEEIEVRDRRIPAGEIVQLSMCAANRDPERFEDPQRLDIERRPMHVLSFGHGPHGCLGARLARDIGQVGLERFFSRVADFEFDDAREQVWYRNAGNRGPEQLPLKITLAG
jgi:cytochrome P450